MSNLFSQLRASAFGAIRCENCGGAEFDSRDGKKICNYCNTESQEHGIETAFDDETFMGLQGLHKQTLKSTKDQELSQSQKETVKKRTRSKTRFSSIDAYTFIFKGWTEELIELGASPAIRQAVVTLWSRYLNVNSYACLREGQVKRYLHGPRGFRDMQLDLFPDNVETYTFADVAGFKKRRNTLKKKMEKRNIDPDEYATNLQKARARRKKRKQFFSSLLQEKESSPSSDSEDEDGEKKTKKRRKKTPGFSSDSSFASFASDATFLSSTSGTSGASDLSGGEYGAGVFGEGFSQDDTLSMSVSGTRHADLSHLKRDDENDDSILFGGPGSSSRKSGGGSESEGPGGGGSGGSDISADRSRRIPRTKKQFLRQERKRDQQLEQLEKEMITQRIKRNEFRGGNKKKRVDFLNLDTAISILIMAVQITEANSITEAQIFYWIRTNALSFATAVKLIPTVMHMDVEALHFVRSLRAFQAKSASRKNDSINFNRIRRLCRSLAWRMDMRVMDLNPYPENKPEEGALVKTIDLYLKEFSLPSSLRSMIVDAIEPLTRIFKMREELPPGVEYYTKFKKNHYQNCHKYLPSVERRAMALILFALKYLYGLDDFTEKMISSSCRFANKKEEDSNYFVFEDWLQLNMKRLHLGCRHSHLLNDKFARQVFDNKVTLTSDAVLDEFVFRDAYINEQKSRFKPVDQKPTKQSNLAIWETAEEITKNLEMATPKEERGHRYQFPKLITSNSPLNELANIITENRTKKFSDSDVKDMKALQKFHSSQIKISTMENKGEKFDPSEVIRSRCKAGVDQYWQFGRHQGHNFGDSPWSMGFEFSFNQDEKMEEKLSKCEQYNLTGIPYWRVKNSVYRRLFDNPALEKMDGSDEWAQNHLMTQLPDNFTNILNVFSACAYLKQSALFAELVNIEESILAQDKEFFGKVFMGAKEDGDN